MSRELRVHFLPELFEPDALRGGIAVVIDVLRASTTIIHALAAGALAVIPCAEIDAAHQAASTLSNARNTESPSPPAGEGRGGGVNAGATLNDKSVLLGGERHGTHIEGFDLDNSPLNYAADVVAGKTIVFTTTNGTRALLLSSRAYRVLIGAFTNIDAIVKLLASEPAPVHLVCAGTDRRISSEDILCAGAIAAGIAQSTGERFSPDDQTDVAIAYFAANSNEDCSLLSAIRESRGGRNLQELGLELDIDRAAMCNVYSVIPEYSPKTGRIELISKADR